MPALASDLRKTLEATVVKARDKAEGGARDALTALAVDSSEPFASMSEEERKLRNRLRARGRQLGDQRDPQKGSQGIERLVREMAYEHWHRMLFARFLAENQLLIEPTSSVAISLDECEELAAEEKTDLWTLAAQFAQEMLPQIFRIDDPVLTAKLPLEIQQQLQGLVAGLAKEVFTASDSLGWTYQFWQTKRKKEVNDSGVKIGADELSPVTQLFTEDYMVDFLLDNTLGAWHAGKVLAENPQLAARAQSEDELRQAVSLPGCPWAYLRFMQSEDGAWSPASGTFEGWPKTAAELKCLDPCMGSGHFVVAMFERLVALRMVKESDSEQAAVAGVIQDNLFGLEIDLRCTQIAAFSLALAAWQRVGHCNLPAMNLACSGLAPNNREADWLALAGNNERLRNGMERLYRLFEKASVLGSLINPRDTGADLLVAGFLELQPILGNVLSVDSHDDIDHEMAVTARGLAKAAEILSGQFTLVATNVPYLGRGDQCELLQQWSAHNSAQGKGDLATTFLDRMLGYGAQAPGTLCVVSPHEWWFLKTSEGFRKHLLQKAKWLLAATLGEEAWVSFGSRGPKATLLILNTSAPTELDRFGIIEALSLPTIPEKIGALCCADLLWSSQSDQINNPDTRITTDGFVGGRLLCEHASSFQGVSTADSPRFVLHFWEISKLASRWQPFQGSISELNYYGGRESVIDLGSLSLEAERLGAAIRGRRAWGKVGVAIRQLRTLYPTLYSGEIFDTNVAVVVPPNAKLLPSVWAFCSSPEFTEAIRRIDKKKNVTNGTMVKVPFDLEYWQNVAADRYPDGLPKPFSADATQWLFNGQPSGADQALHVAVARLIGYQWPRQTGSSFSDCPDLEADVLADLADDDGIVALAPVRGEACAVERLRKLLAVAFGEEWSSAKERELLLATAIDNKTKKSDTDLESWLRNSFFSEHCKLFCGRPFVWQVWDGNPQGFSALVNYHKLSGSNGQARKTLEQLSFTYLGDWIDLMKLEQVEGINGADDRLVAALDLQGQLKKILDGEPPYDLFVRWKPLHQQAIGWDPDINDGVRLNIRPFLNAQLRKGGKAGAGILRAKPGTIKWAKDRGKEPMRSKEEFPWFWGWDETDHALATDFGAPIQGAPPAGDSFDGNRWNDLHYTRAAKEASRALHRGDS